MKRFVTASITAFAVLCTVGVGAQADTVSWTYNVSTSATNNELMGSQGGSILLGISNNGTGPGSGEVTGTSIIDLANLKNQSTSATTENLLDKTFTMSLQLSSLQSGITNNTATLNFQVSLQGINGSDPTFSKNNANVTLLSFTPLAGSGVTLGSDGSATVTLGSFNFTVSDPSFTFFGPGSQLQGSTSVLVTVTDNSGGGGIASAPEPSTMLLSCLGGLSFVGAAWRRRREARR
jgi:PEP-CTERM motif